jgi:predicted HTH domain antitoxin
MILTVKIDVPDGVLSALRMSPTEFARERRVAAALLWYAQGEISQSVGAEIAGISRAEFIDELSRRRISVVQVTPEQLQEEIDRE